MSFDLALSKGDLTLANDGDIRKVRNNSKLIQDVLKELHIPKQSDPFNLSRGVELTADKIGEGVNKQFIESKMTADIIETLNRLVAIQSRQGREQILTEAEQIKDLGNIEVSQDSLDPRQYNIKLTVITKGYSELEIPEFTFVTTLEE